ncbi:unnamed protein product [Bursaphelenchus xylophilus]|uniref:(pine wood nematode) hypothetical protein n=1 Tax=Bursaphelenchus xylophilus TaxID=6326 RepID=A0A1I7SWH6_BURXY|nr:unnamed protein product [Bursaphelenchus xylophilus]CAG9099428.1 unnamed protein product [Bursaphelenchus xylophilus]
MADAARGILQSFRQTKNLYLNPHEHFGRQNICRAALLTYVGIFFAFKWNSNRKARKLEAEKHREKQNVLNDALARAGLS